ncbi:MAG: hypothetical protein Q8R83_11130 [Legionellaceae bacterium]|nr:hypothetical protein [Legionellaceae bacterium]
MINSKEIDALTRKNTKDPLLAEELIKARADRALADIEFQTAQKNKLKHKQPVDVLDRERVSYYYNRKYTTLEYIGRILGLKNQKDIEFEVNWNTRNQDAKHKLNAANQIFQLYKTNLDIKTTIQSNIQFKCQNTNRLHQKIVAYLASKNGSSFQEVSSDTKLVLQKLLAFIEANDKYIAWNDIKKTILNHPNHDKDPKRLLQTSLKELKNMYKNEIDKFEIKIKKDASQQAKDLSITQTIAALLGFFSYTPVEKDKKDHQPGLQNEHGDVVHTKSQL